MIGMEGRVRDESKWGEGKTFSTLLTVKSHLLVVVCPYPSLSLFASYFICYYIFFYSPPVCVCFPELICCPKHKHQNDLPKIYL